MASGCLWWRLSAGASNQQPSTQRWVGHGASVFTHVFCPNMFGVTGCHHGTLNFCGQRCSGICISAEHDQRQLGGLGNLRRASLEAQRMEKAWSAEC